MVRIIVLTLLLASNLLFAQNQNIPAFNQNENPSINFKPKSVKKAYLLSGGAIVYTVAVFGIRKGEAKTVFDKTLAVTGIAGYIIGPTFGNMYAKNYSRVSVGIGMRVLGITLYVVGALNLMYDKDSTLDEDSPSSPFHNPISIAGTVLFIGSYVWDFATIPSSVKKYNEKKRGLSFSPILKKHQKRAMYGLAINF